MSNSKGNHQSTQHLVPIPFILACLFITLLKSLTESYPVDRAHSLVETRLMSPSLSEAVARAAVSSGFPFNRIHSFYTAINFNLP